MSGTKAELLSRLMHCDTAPPADEAKGAEGEKKKKAGKEGYEGNTVAELKVLCKGKGLAVSGKKGDIIQRLKDFDLSLGPVEGGQGGDSDIATSSESDIISSNDNEIVTDKSDIVINVNDNLYQMYNMMSERDLRDVCTTKYVDSTGNKADMLQALMSAIHNEKQSGEGDFNFSGADSSDPYSAFYKTAMAKEALPLMVLPPAVKKYREIK